MKIGDVVYKRYSGLYGVSYEEVTIVDILKPNKYQCFLLTVQEGNSGFDANTPELIYDIIDIHEDIFCAKNAKTTKIIKEIEKTQKTIEELEETIQDICYDIEIPKFGTKEW